MFAMQNRLVAAAALLLVAPTLAWAAAPPAAPAAPGESVVRITATRRFPDPTKPWSRLKSSEVAGTGVVISGNRILTNAHLVVFATEIQVQAKAGADKVDAKVERLGVDVDLAILSIADKTFFDKKPALPRMKAMPKVRDNVEVFGFPIGGEGMSVTKGVISRIGFGGDEQGLVLQISAAINPGNSGGPAVVNGKMAGVVVSRLRNAENIGYVIANEEIDFFLKNAKAGKYEGKPKDATLTEYQGLENETLREMLKLPKKIRGILAQPSPSLDKGNPFREFDVVTHIGSHAIDNKGVVLLPGGIEAPFNGLIPRLTRNDRVPLTVWRGGKSVVVHLPVSTRDNRLVPQFKGEPATYFIHGPLTFAPVQELGLSFYLEVNRSRKSPLWSRQNDSKKFPNEQLVVAAAPIFEHKSSKGYTDPFGHVLLDLNGRKVKNLSHLLEMLRDCKDEYLKFRFEEGAGLLVFKRKQMEAVTEEVLEEAGIARKYRGSKDMMEVWKRKKVSGPAEKKPAEKTADEE
jgi:S1-C subfamily serine protease